MKTQHKNSKRLVSKVFEDVFEQAVLVKNALPPTREPHF